MQLRSVLTFAISITAASGLPAQEGGPPASVLDSVFTVEQADRGDQVFMRTCIDCHLPEEFSTAGYLTAWEGEFVAELLDYLRENMPEDNPGSLLSREYFDVTAYILKLNGIPAGGRELDRELAKNTRIELP